MPFRNLFILIAALFAAHDAFAKSPKVFHYEPEKVVLSGRLEAKTFLGPPGYGESPETDAKEVQYILTLVAPIDVQETKGNDINVKEVGVRQITLVVLDFKAIPVKPFLGNRR